MRVGLVMLWMVAGCYERESALVGAGGGGDDDCEAAPQIVVEDRGPVEADEIPAWVEGQSDLVDEGNGILHCNPHDPESDEQYGCLADDGRCVPTPGRVRVKEGMLMLSLDAECADRFVPHADESGTREVRLDGVPVPPNRVLWTIEIQVPVSAIDPGQLMALWDTPCATATFRIEDTVSLEADQCGHEPLVNVQDDGYRNVQCRREWRPFRADVGVVPGLLAHSNIAFSSADPVEGDLFSMELNMVGCGATELAMVGADGSPVPMNCCAGHAERGLEWAVGPGGMLLDGPSPYLGGYCCLGADMPFPDGNCGGADPGAW